MLNFAFFSKILMSTSTPGLALACLGLHADTDGLRLIRCRIDQCSHKGAADHYINGGSGTPGYLQFAFELLGAYQHSYTSY